MAEECSMEASSSRQVHGEEPEVEVNIKTLDSQIYSFRVKKNMRVSLFKEKVASTIGVPVAQQRLIFRGKVLKDDHFLSEYHVENGHTLHLVERLPAQMQNQPGANPAGHTGDSDSQGNESTTTGPRGRIGQVSHSVVLGTFNIGGDQVEGVVPDLGRIIGAVLNSVGIGNLTATGGTGNMSSATSSNSAVQATQSAEAAGPNVGTGVQVQTGNQGQSGQGFPTPFQSLYQPLQLPLTGGAVAFPPQNMVIPDALTTLTQFINRMQVVLSGSQSSLPADDQARPDTALPSTRGLPTPEALGTVVHRTRLLLSEHAGAALSTQSVSELKDFVKKLNSLPEMTRHINLAQHLSTFTSKPSFLGRLDIEHTIIDGQSYDICFDYIEEMIHKQEPIVAVLRLLVLLSVTNSGLPKKNFDYIRREILHSYGFEHMPTLYNLEKVGLLKKQESKTYWPTIKRSLQLVVDDTDTANPNDIAYVFSGYAPLSIRLVQHAVRSGWRPIEEIVKLLPGPHSEFKRGGYSRTSSLDVLQGNPGNLDRVGDGRRSLVLVVFIGGVTFAEIAALRFLAAQEGMAYDLIVGTTKIVNGSTLLNTFTDSLT